MVGPMLNQGDQVAISERITYLGLRKAALDFGFISMAAPFILGLQTCDGAVLRVDRTPMDAALDG